MDSTHDKMFYDQGELLGGIDEAGVSDIAGPLVAACVILPKIDLHEHDLRIFEVNDSKQIPEKYRKQHAEVVWQVATAIGIGEVQPFEIDYLGKYGAMRLAMMRAIAACKRTTNKKLVKPDFLLIDGELGIPTSIPHKLIHQADTKSLCVAAASIVAKVYRDEIMIKLHDQFPYYGWDSNKGYPCEDHFSGLDTHGVQLGVHRTKCWPFVQNHRDSKDRVLFKDRRNAWRRITEDRISASLEGKSWPIKTESFKPSINSKSSLEQDPQPHSEQPSP